MVKQSCLVSEMDLKMEEISKDKMCLAKSYAAHTSFVNQCETNTKNQEFLFTTGVNDECVIKWKFVQEEQLWDLDNLEYQKDHPDVFSEMLPFNEFEQMQNVTLVQRTKITAVTDQALYKNPPHLSLVEQQELRSKLPIRLELVNSIGRKAHNRLNNLFYDFNENIIYIDGCNLVVTNPRTEEFPEDPVQSPGGQIQLRQEFIRLDQSPDSTSPEISCFSLSNDLKFLIAGTIQTNARIIIWDISSRTCINTITLQGTSMVVMVKFAHDNRHAVASVVTKAYSLMIYLLDTHLNQVLGCANFIYSAPYRIKDNAVNWFFTLFRGRNPIAPFPTEILLHIKGESKKNFIYYSIIL